MRRWLVSVESARELFLVLSGKEKEQVLEGGQFKP